MNRYAPILALLASCSVFPLRAAEAVQAPKASWVDAKGVLVRSCFACHAPALAPAAKENASLLAKRRRMMMQAQEGFPMGATFPFEGGDSAAKQLKGMKKMVASGKMPPRAQKALGLGSPLSAADRSTLLGWIETGLEKK